MKTDQQQHLEDKKPLHPEQTKHSLKQFLMQLPFELETSTAIHFVNLVLDSRKVNQGDLFIAVKGEEIDGRKFIEKAIKKGAVAVIAEQDQNFVRSYSVKTIPVIRVPNLKKHLGAILNRWFHFPSHQLCNIGITGTNGKTSCSYFLAQGLHSMGIKAGMTGTLGQGTYPNLHPLNNTTPSLYTAQNLLSQWVKEKINWSVMEVTSHALVQGRVEGIQFDTALFTNISRDHLDYHKTMDDYVQAKAQLFSTPNLKHAVINKDDAYAQVMLDHIGSKTKLWTYSLEDQKADIYLTKCVTTNNKLLAEIITPWGCGSFQTPLIGRFNLYNLLGVIGILGAQQFCIEKIMAAVESMSNAPGRMATYGGRDGKPKVVIDFSHTPDALQKALQAIREQTNQRIICIFGCGGNRDKGKRPLMMKTALNYADDIVLTSDNPRFEDPMEIIHDTIRQLSKHELARVTIIKERKEAIAKTIGQSDTNSTILIAGKGHENYQEINGIKYPLDDSTEAQKALQTL